MQYLTLVLQNVFNNSDLAEQKQEEQLSRCDAHLQLLHKQHR